MAVHCLESGSIGLYIPQDFPRPWRCPSGISRDISWLSWMYIVHCTMYIQDNPIHPSSRQCTDTIFSQVILIILKALRKHFSANVQKDYLLSRVTLDVWAGCTLDGLHPFLLNSQLIATLKSQWWALLACKTFWKIHSECDVQYKCEKSFISRGN